MKPTSFSELNLPRPLMQAIDDLGFTHLTPVQQAALPMALAGKDIAGQGRTGTGKTATFLIAAINRLLRNAPKSGRRAEHPRVVIIAPTRELVVQIFADAKALARHTDLKLHAVFGGVDYEKQRKGFAMGVDILIGTPGRLIDYLKQRLYSLSKVEMLIIDEADRMFDLGFIKDLRFILRRLPRYDRRQSLLFSATLSHRVIELAYEHMNNPEQLRAEEGGITAEGVEESLFFTAMEEKFPLLVQLLRQWDVARGMIFVNEKQTAVQVARELARYGFAVGVLSGDVRQKKRLRVLKRFSEGDLQLLVATDVASRGLHIEGVSHVFNYDLPEEAENYVHRIGRTARAGARGVAVSFCCERYCSSLPDIESYIGHTIPRKYFDDAMLDIGEPSHPDAVAEGLGGEHRAQPATARRKKDRGGRARRSPRKRAGA